MKDFGKDVKVVIQIDKEPKLNDSKYYPRGPGSCEGWCQWYVTGRLREIFGTDIIPEGTPWIGSLKENYVNTPYNGYTSYGEWVEGELPEYFNKSNSPEAGSIVCTKEIDHVAFVRDVDIENNQMIIESGNQSGTIPRYYGYSGN